LFTGQVGYAWNNVLWYVKGGAAVTDDKFRGTVTTAPFQGFVFDSASETRWGGVVGTGIEFGFAPNWSVAIEYDHLFMGNHSNSFTSAGVLGAAVIPVGGVFRTDSIRQDVDLITARINYRFNWGGPVVAKY
jgi:outer membrane immunogenic protein